MPDLDFSPSRNAGAKDGVPDPGEGGLKAELGVPVELVLTG